MPIPDSSRPAAMQVARQLGIEYREGFFKNRYVGRTFIMPGQQKRNKSVRLNCNKLNFKSNKTNFLIDCLNLEKGEYLENCFRLENLQD